MSAIDSPTTSREGFAKLSPTNPPCPGFGPEEWRAIHEQATAFLEARDAEAAGKG